MQIAHYPLFPLGDMARFGEYPTWLIKRTAIVTVPLWLLEIVAAAWLAVGTVPTISPVIPCTGFAIVLLLWLVTGFVQFPLHAKLTTGFNQRLFRLVLRTN